MVDQETKRTEADFIRSLETAVLEVLGASDIDPVDKIRAIQAGTQLLAVKHKIRDGEQEKNFFGGGE
jgi:hypothetical protein